MSETNINMKIVRYSRYVSNRKLKLIVECGFVTVECDGINDSGIIFSHIDILRISRSTIKVYGSHYSKHTEHITCNLYLSHKCKMAYQVLAKGSNVKHFMV